MASRRQKRRKTAGPLARIGIAFAMCCLETACALCQEVFVSAGGLGLDGQTGWTLYQDYDAPEGAFLARLPSGVSQVTANVDLGQVAPAGDYTLFLKAIDYDFKSRAQVSISNATLGVRLDDRDEDKYWTKVGVLRLAEPVGRLRVVFTKTVAASTPTQILFRALYLVPGTNNVVVTATDQTFTLHYPATAEYDNSPAVKGNMLRNSSFEVGVGQGWTLAWSKRNWTRASLWDTNVAYHGKASIRFDAKPSPPQQLVSLPIRLKPNKRYTLSAYVRSSGRNWAEIRLVNSMKPPSDMPAAQELVTRRLLTSSTAWQRLVLSERVLAYPSDQFHIYLGAQDYDGSQGSIWFDGVQLEEGDSSPYEPRDTLDLGVLMPTEDSIFYPSDVVAGRLVVANHSSSPRTATVHYHIYDHLLHSMKKGTMAVSVGPNSLDSWALPLGVQKLGSFRGAVWTDDFDAAEEEFLYSVVPEPVAAGLDETSIIGVHSDLTDWQLRILQRVGVKWSRCLSPGWQFRWEIAEPTEGRFVWFDEEIKRAGRYGVSLLANIGENAPAWAHRTFFTFTNLAGAFQIGEVVKASNAASGRITLVLDAGSATGWGLQLGNVLGTFSEGSTVTGQLSGARATISSPVHPTAIALDKWETFVRSVVSHYRSNVKWWEIWNEPNVDVKEVPNIAFYAEMLKRALRAIKGTDPDARIVAMGGVSHPDWIDGVVSKLPSGWQTDISGLSVHLYPGNESRARLFKTKTVDVYAKPVWNSETGVWDWGGFTGVNANVARNRMSLYAHRAGERFYRGAVREPASLAHNFLRSVGGGLSKYFYYDARNSSCRADFFDSHPTLIDYNEGLRPKGVAYVILAHLFDHSTGLGAVTTQDALTEAYLFERGGVPTVAMFSADGKERLADLSALLDGQAIRVLDSMGNALPNPAAQVRYGRFPTYVVGKGVSVDQLRQAIQRSAIQVLPDTEAPRLAITVGPRCPVSVGDELYLRWLAIDDVSLPSAVDPVALRYSWRLEGTDSDWTPWSATTSYSYSGLRPGQYTFRVKAQDQAGNISATESRAFVVLGAGGLVLKPRPPVNLRTDPPVL